MPFQKKQLITVYEHESLCLGHSDSGTVFNKQHLEELQCYHGAYGTDCFSLIHQGIRFNSRVGVLQVGRLTIEVLPKADRDSNEEKWRNILFLMLKNAGVFPVSAESLSSLRIRTNNLLDLYFSLFLTETEKLLHHGLVKKYRKEEANLGVLKGSLKIPEQIRHNSLHRERFYVRYNSYDRQHPLNQILYKTLQLVHWNSGDADIVSRARSLLMAFPETKDIRVSEELFQKIRFDRKTDEYRGAMQIAKLLLLNYHPDLRTGQNHVLALMFDMNLLWERFIFHVLNRIRLPGIRFQAQVSRDFWKAQQGTVTRIRPDILIHQEGTGTRVIDTKWKRFDSGKASAEDLKQMYVYGKYYHAKEVSLLYPGAENDSVQGSFADESPGMPGIQCRLVSLKVQNKMEDWIDLLSREIIA